MQTNCQPTDKTTVKFLSVETKPAMTRIAMRVYPAVYEELNAIARQEELEISTALRELLALGLRYYKHKRGTLNPNLTQNKKTFFCQSCKAETSMRDVVYKTLDFDQYMICETCYFNRDKLRSFVSKMLQGV